MWGNEHLFSGLPYHPLNNVLQINSVTFSVEMDFIQLKYISVIVEFFYQYAVFRFYYKFKDLWDQIMFSYFYFEK